eukprot:3526639-Prymnesium_polylepis.1
MKKQKIQEPRPRDFFFIWLWPLRTASVSELGPTHPHPVHYLCTEKEGRARSASARRGVLPRRRRPRAHGSDVARSKTKRAPPSI